MKPYLFSFFTALFGLKEAFCQNMLAAGSRQYKLTAQGDAGDWVAVPGVEVKQGDFVVFEATGKVSYGFFAGSGFADGLDDYRLKGYNYVLSCKHGALLCQNGDAYVEAFSQSSLWDPAEKFGWSVGFKEVSFVGYHFISKVTQPLKFIVNEKDFGNNKGSFNVTVTIMPLQMHVGRNSHNKCPIKMPATEVSLPPPVDRKTDSWDAKYYLDDKGYIWTYKTREFFFHGGGWLETPMKYHMLWDVFPHGDYLDYYKKTDKIFLYEPTKNLY